MITVDDTSPVPTFEQIRSQIADQIHTARLPAGAKLPSVRQLAGDLRIAPGTVARAYSELESAGLVTTSRATGTRVRAGFGICEHVERAARAFVETAQAAGLSLGEAQAAVRSQWR